MKNINEPTALMVQRFEAVLAELGYAYFITWTWHYAAGRGYRHGVLTVYDVAKGCDYRIDVEPFARQTHRWTKADEWIGRLRHGSPKAWAVSAMLRRILALV